MIISNNSIDEVAEEFEEDQDSPLDGDLDEPPLLLTSSTSNIETTALDQPAPSTPSEQTVLNRPALNTTVARETERRFLAALRPEYFLNNLPLKSAQLPNFLVESEVGQHFATVAGARSKTRMCEKFIKALGRPLTEFHSSHQFISAIADAMEAQNNACFDTGILHRDISVGNILITEDNKGILIDWDLGANMDTVAARPPTRMGTWQFMSAQLLESSDSVHQMEDDRESAFHVLLWVAMRYSGSHVLSSDNPSSASTQDPPRTGMRTYTRQFDEAYIDDSGTPRGGCLKMNLFTTNKLSKLKFDDRPQLSALLEELAEVFRVRYGRAPEPDDLKALAIQEALIARNRDPELLDEMKFARDHTTAYQYQKRKGHLEKERHWLVNTIRKHLNTGIWPEDKAELQKIFQITSKRASLETRSSSKNR